MTAASTPVVCRFAGLGRYATGRAPPINGRLSVGRTHSKAGPSAGVSPRTIFTGRSSFHRESPAGTYRHARAAAESPSTVLHLSPFNRIVNVVGGTKCLRPTPKRTFGCDSDGVRNIGEDRS